MGIIQKVERFLIESALVKLTDEYAALAARPLTENHFHELTLLEARIVVLLERLERMAGAGAGGEFKSEEKSMVAGVRS